MLLALCPWDSPGKNTGGRGVPFPFPGDPPSPGIKPPSLPSPALAGGFFTSSATWEAHTRDTVYEITVKAMCELQSASWQISHGT